MQKKSLSRGEVATLVLFSAIVFGGLFRFLAPWLAGFPINDGGMFYVMIQELQANQFIPPAFTAYNNLNIPFAYPPLAFYIGAFLGTIGFSEIELLRWLPAFFNILTIPAFFILAREIVNDHLKASLATLAFALTPHMNTWFSAGGGITRSLGALFMILMVFHAWRLFVKEDLKSMWGIILTGSLTVLSHTESSIYAVVFPILIWLTKSRSIRTAIQACIVAAGVILIAGTWYGWVIFQHGLEPYISALQTGGQTIWSLLKVFNIEAVTEEHFLDLLGVVGLLGMTLLIWKRDFFLPLMFLVAFIIQPRSAHTIGNIPLAMAAGVFVAEVLIPVYREIKPQGVKQASTGITWLLFSAFLLLNFTYQCLAVSQFHVTKSERDAASWIQEHTPPGSRFLLLSGENDPMCDPFAEWFPALTGRTSILTLQGREWLKQAEFTKLIQPRADVQACIDKGPNCLEQEILKNGFKFDYLYIAINSSHNWCATESSSNNSSLAMIHLLEQADDYQKVIEFDDGILFAKQ